MSTTQESASVPPTSSSSSPTPANPLSGNTTGQSMASAIADAVRGQGLMPPSTPTPAGNDGPGHSSAPPSQQQDASVTSPAPTGTPADAASGAEGQASSTTSPAGIKKVSILQDEYKSFLDMKSKFEEMEKKQREAEAERAKMAEQLKEWENIGSTIGGSSDPEASKKIVENLRAQEIRKFLDKVDEIMPDLDAIYKESEGSGKKDMEPIIRALKSYQLNSHRLKDPGELEGAKGLVEVVTRASRNANTRFSQMNAKIEELQRKNAEKEKALAEAKKREEEFAKKAALYAQSGNALSGVKTIEPTIIGGPAQPGANVPQANNTTVNTTASSGSMSSSSRKRKTTYPAGRDPFSMPPGYDVGMTYQEMIQKAGGLQNLRTTASSSSGATSYEDYERQRDQQSQSVTVMYNDDVPVEIEVQKWEPENTGFSALGPNYIGNATFDWIKECIKRGSIVDFSASITAQKEDNLMTVEEGIRSGAIKRPRHWK